MDFYNIFVIDPQGFTGRTPIQQLCYHYKSQQIKKHASKGELNATMREFFERRDRGYLIIDQWYNTVELPAEEEPNIRYSEDECSTFSAACKELRHYFRDFPAGGGRK